MRPDPRPYPRWWIDAAARRRELLDGAVARLAEQLRAIPAVRGALIFGSYATGRVGPTSDLDVIVVAEPDPDVPVRRHGDTLRSAISLNVPCDLIVYTPEQFERLSRERNFVAQARREGIWIDATAPR